MGLRGARSIIGITDAFFMVDGSASSPLLRVAKQNNKEAEGEDNLWKYLLFVGVPAVYGLYKLVSENWDYWSKKFDTAIDVIKEPIENFRAGVTYLKSMFDNGGDELNGPADNTGVPAKVIAAGKDKGAAATSTPIPGKAIPSAAPLPGSDNTSVPELIKLISKQQGVDPSLLLAMAQIESTLNVGAINSITGAKGLFQFLPSTWNDLVTRTYKDLGYTSSDIDDKRKHIVVAARWFSGIQRSLHVALGHAPSASEIYMVHFLGPSGGLRFLEALKHTPDTAAAPSFKGPAASNPRLFFDDKGKPLSFRQVYAKVFGKVTKAYAQATDADSAKLALADSAVALPTSGSGTASQTPENQPSTVGSSPVLTASASQAVGTAKATMAPQSGPNLDAMPMKSKAAPIAQNTQVADSGTATPMMMPEAGSRNTSKTLVRDKNGRILSLVG